MPQELDQDYMKKLCPELKALPDDWTIKAVSENNPAEKYHIFFQNRKGATTYTHPTLGPLPKPWVLKLCSVTDGGSNSRTGGKSRIPKYFNKVTKESRDKDPRFSPETLKARVDSLTHENNIAGSLKKMKPGMALENMKRQDIGTKDIRHNYDILKAIDPGDGTIGGMNGGVFVVRLKNQSRLSVEKRYVITRSLLLHCLLFSLTQCRFKPDGVQAGMKEIRMLHRLKHASLTFYMAAFVSPDLRKASVYVEFCDRGSLGDLIKNYQLCCDKNPRPLPPERFIWHVFAGLADGLAYLQGGRSYIGQNVTDYSIAPGWIPILHRDIKPDNVLLRSRDTLGSSRYFYCVLSDFGLACEDRPRQHPNADRNQRDGTKVGTTAFYAPELLYNPYPRSQEQLAFFPGSSLHSIWSDVWALGACIFILAECRAFDHNKRNLMGPFSHINFWEIPQGLDVSIFISGTASRLKLLELSSPRYSGYLRNAIIQATEWNAFNRPHAREMVVILKDAITRAGFMDNRPPADDEQLPKWATRVHDYHSREPLDPRTFKS